VAKKQKVSARNELLFYSKVYDQINESIPRDIPASWEASAVIKLLDDWKKAFGTEKPRFGSAFNHSVAKSEYSHELGEVFNLKDGFTDNIQFSAHCIAAANSLTYDIASFTNKSEDAVSKRLFNLLTGVIETVSRERSSGEIKSKFSVLKIKTNFLSLFLGLQVMLNKKHNMRNTSLSTYESDVLATSEDKLISNFKKSGTWAECDRRPDTVVQDKDNRMLLRGEDKSSLEFIDKAFQELENKMIYQHSWLYTGMLKFRQHDIFLNCD
jgi:hypothetical protein